MVSISDEVEYLRRRAASLGYRLVQKNKPKQKPGTEENPRAGARWEPEELETVKRMLAEGKDLSEMKTYTRRSAGAVLSKLCAVRELFYQEGRWGWTLPREHDLRFTFDDVRIADGKKKPGNYR